MKKRIYTYDILRMIATFSVILIHVSALAFADKAMNHHSVVFINRFVSFAVPVFIYLSGAMIYERYNKSYLDYFDFFYQKWVKILIPYIVFSVIYYVMVVYMNQGELSLMACLKQLLLGSAMYHLYFIPIIIQLFILTPLFIWLKKYKPLLVIGLACVISYFAYIYLQFEFSDRLFIKYITPFLLGLYYGKTFIKEILAKKVIVAVATLVGVMQAGLFVLHFNGLEVIPHLIESLWFVYSIVSCLALVVVSEQITHKKFALYAKQFAGVSFYIFLLHPMILAGLKRVVYKLNSSSVTVNLILLYVTTCGVSIFIAWLIVRAVTYLKQKMPRLY